jgi:hypothetical protein
MDRKDWRARRRAARSEIRFSFGFDKTRQKRLVRVDLRGKQPDIDRYPQLGSNSSLSGSCRSEFEFLGTRACFIDSTSDVSVRARYPMYQLAGMSQEYYQFCEDHSIDVPGRGMSSEVSCYRSLASDGVG